MQPASTLEEHTVTHEGHTTFYLAAGPEDGPLIIFVHGWPELSLSWRHQLPALAALGFRAVAPDMRGYGRSSTYQRYGDHAQRRVVGDMMALLAGLGRSEAIWVGHDWGAPTVWSIASHHPEACTAVAGLCVPYFTLERGLQACVDHVNRDVYGDQYPAGQWEYQLFYEEHFERARAEMEANPLNTVKLLFRKGDPSGAGAPAATAMTRINGGWFGPAGEAPDFPRDDDVISEDDLRVYADALSRNGFFGPNAYYMNHTENAAYAAEAVNDGYLDMPVLFLGARYDYVCECYESTLAEPMRERCRRLTETTVYSGHWMAQERPLDVNAALVRWLATSVPEAWPASRAPDAA